MIYYYFIVLCSVQTKPRTFTSNSIQGDERRGQKIPGFDYLISRFLIITTTKPPLCRTQDLWIQGLVAQEQGEQQTHVSSIFNFAGV